MSRGPQGGVTLVVEQLRRDVAGGIGTYVRALLGALTAIDATERGRIELFASRPPGATDPLRGYRLPLRTSRLPPRAMAQAWDRSLVGLRHHSAVVHALSLQTPPWCSPLVVTVHDVAFREAPETFTARGRAWHEAALRRAARRAALFVVPSVAVAHGLSAARVGITADRVVVIEEGADHLPPPDKEATAALLAAVGVHGEFLLSVGTIEPRKNLPRLFAAYRAIRSELPEPWPLVVCGPMGWLAGGEPPPPGVVMVGRVDEPVLAGLYAMARVVAYVPLVEGFGLPVVEAMRAGAIVVASDVPSSAGAALEVNARDVASIAAGLLSAAVDEELRTTLVARARHRVGPLTWSATARDHLAVWRRAAQC
jgi:glycosyltransferase involved in cell wall biosynthesis